VVGQRCRGTEREERGRTRKVQTVSGYGSNESAHAEENREKEITSGAMSKDRGRVVLANPLLSLEERHRQDTGVEAIMSDWWPQQR